VSWPARGGARCAIGRILLKVLATAAREERGVVQPVALALGQPDCGHELQK
jgi:hypothetical protein